MKLIDSRFTSGRPLGLFLALVLAAGAYAGPSPQCGSQPPRQQAQIAARATAAASADAPAMACPLCRIRVIGEFSAANPSGKWAPHTIAVGVEHDCTGCRGAIATVRGQVTNGMANDCAVCAQAHPSCCTTSG